MLECEADKSFLKKIYKLIYIHIWPSVLLEKVIKNARLGRSKGTVYLVRQPKLMMMMAAAAAAGSSPIGLELIFTRER